MVSSETLDTYLEKNISQICGNGYTQDNDNHCAHFVSHVLGYSFGYTCKAAMQGSSQTGASLRVHEVFARCSVVGAWSNRPLVLIGCLVFVTTAADVNVQKKTMNNVPKKHIGIYSYGMIWHYSNLNHKVMKQTPEDFVKHYPGPGYALFYGYGIP